MIDVRRGRTAPCAAGCALVLAAVLTAVLAGCPRAPCAGAARIDVDGRFEDWPPGAQLAFDDDHLYVRLALPAERTLQASLPLTVALDADASAAEPFASDLELRFSPPESERQGVAVVAMTGAAEQRLPSHAALDLVVAPTYAARTFELRIGRDVKGVPQLTEKLAHGLVRVRATAYDAQGGVVWQGPVHELRLAPRPSGVESSSARGVTIPAPPEAGLRVVSWNVLLASPRRRPAPFGRVLRALRPDVVLLQEWEGATPEELVAWFAEHVAADAPWHAVTSGGWGVAVVARGALSPLGPRLVPRPAGAPADPRRDDQALRLVAGLAQTPLGPLCAASLHLKCCGSAESPQEAQRRVEARLASETLRAAFDAVAPCIRVVGGDLNLVGSRVPLDLLRGALDRGGTALAVAETPVLADRATYTWFQPWARFAPGRLDYLLLAEGVARERSFALDARRLEQSALAAAALEQNDGGASDHLPIVLDLRAAPSG